jgi:hypothetical protein
MHDITLKPLWMPKNLILTGYECGYGPRDRKMHIRCVERPTVKRLARKIVHESIHRVVHDLFGYRVCKQLQNIQYNIKWRCALMKPRLKCAGCGLCGH